MNAEKQVEIFDKTLTELADFNWLIRKSLVRLEEAIDSLQGVALTLKRIEGKIDTISVQTIKEVDLHD